MGNSEFCIKFVKTLPNLSIFRSELNCELDFVFNFWDFSFISHLVPLGEQAHTIFFETPLQNCMPLIEWERAKELEQF